MILRRRAPTSTLTSRASSPSLQVLAFDAGLSTSGCSDASDTKTFLWGCNTSYQLAKGDNEEDEVVPIAVRETKAFNSNRVVCISFGGQHTGLVGVHVEKPEAAADQGSA